MHTRLPDPLTSQSQETTFGVLQLNAAVRLLTYSDEAASLVPFLLHQAKSPNRPEPLIAQYLMVRHATDEQLAYGMNFAVVCSEDAPRWQQENVSTQAVAAT